ncbi:MAG: glycosyltransferase [Blastocatellales bacterium]
MSDDRIKILHVIDSLAVGGMERVVIDVVNGLDRDLFDQLVCTISRPGECADMLRARLIDLGKGDGADYLIPLKLARVIGEHRPDIIHSQSLSGIDAALALTLAGGSRLVQSEHGRSFPHIATEPLRRRLARRFVYHRADAVFAVTAELRDHYCRLTGLPRERMSVIPNGIDPRRIDPADGREVRSELGIPGDAFVIGTVARLDRTKDTMTLLNAFRLLAGDDRMRLLIVGDGEERTALEQAAAGIPVIFTGMRMDAPRMLSAMDIFALPSLSEAMPITVLEAMCASLPVVATTVGALHEMVVEGVTGYLVPVRSPDAMAGRLGLIAQSSDRGREMGRAGRERALREFTLDAMLGRYRDLYLQMMK